MAEPKRLCIIDDEPEIREVMSIILADAFAIREFGSGQEALPEIIAGSFDVVVTDFHMPDITGLELTRQLRQLGHTLPVIVVTGKDSRDSDMVELKTFVATHVVSKPFDPRKLRQIIEDVLKSHIAKVS